MRTFWCFIASAVLNSSASAQTPAPPLVKEGQTVKLSEHVLAIPDERVPMVPNVGIAAGKRASLVLDPGMGAHSGEIVMRELA